ncbi:MAG TPA: hypothetical protein VLX44_06105 [Xanthobacteraceae bacterium]|nr:hypothetical protein [Xanthobacteraceae bacterium]
MRPGALRCGAISFDIDRQPPLIEIDRRDRRGLDIGDLSRRIGRGVIFKRRRRGIVLIDRRGIGLLVEALLVGRRQVRRSVSDAGGFGLRRELRLRRFARLARRRTDRFGRGEELVGVAQARLPNRAAANAANLAAVRPQAFRLDIIGCGAGRADDEHGESTANPVARHPTV